MSLSVCEGHLEGSIPFTSCLTEVILPLLPQTHTLLQTLFPPRMGKNVCSFDLVFLGSGSRCERSGMMGY